MSELEPRKTQPKWHESMTEMFSIFAVICIVTSPCWGAALVLGVLAWWDSK